MLNIIWKNKSLRNNIVISDRIPNVYVFKVNGLSCELSSDENTADIENMICAILWNLEWKLELDDEIVLVVEWKRVPMEQKKGEIDRIRIHVYLMQPYYLIVYPYLPSVLLMFYT